MNIGIDIGGTKADGVMVAGAEVVERVRVPVRPSNEGVVQTIMDVVDRLCAQAEVGRREIEFIGIGVPGQVRPGGTVITHAVNLRVESMDLAAELAPYLAARVRADNDVNAAALGVSIERRSAHARESLAFLNVGTGVAAAVVLDGQVWRGRAGVAGEIGHLSIDATGPRCVCGQRGCIEAYLGGRAVADRWGSGGELPIRDLFDAADGGDDRADTMVGEMINALRVAINVLTLTMDVDAIVLGGGVTLLANRLMSPLRATLEADAADSDFMRSLGVSDRVAVLDQDSMACARGAAALSGDRTP